MNMKDILSGKARKPTLIMLTVLGILFGGIFLYKGFGSIMTKRFFAASGNPIITVSTAKATYATWTKEIKAVGSTRAMLGVNVTAQIGGMIQKIYFTPGSIVEKGTVLVQQNADPNIGLLHSLQANAELAKITYKRDLQQYKVQGVSKQQLDSDLQNLKSLNAQVEQQKAIVDQLTITAPFTGRLGISKVYPGQFLNPGDTVVTLQSLDPIYVDFYLPQQALPDLQVGHDINMTVDSFPDKTFEGVITTINPTVESSTRNFEAEATLPNPNHELLPGMFTNVTVIRNDSSNYLTLPITAVTFNPYGEVVYIVTSHGMNEKGEPELTVSQSFVTTGTTRGDQIAILKGLNEGDEVVTSGQLKLKNGSRVAINNSVAPSDSENPALPDEHGQG